MHTISLIGDCHLARVYEYHKDSSPNIKFWGTAGLRIFGLDFLELSNNNKLSSGTEIGNKDPVAFKDIEDSEIVVLWIGYVDIRQHLPKYKNAEIIVKEYVENALSFFKDKIVIFADPLPQFDKMYLKYEGISPEYTYDEREKQNKEFLFYLKKYAAEYGCPEPISQKEIFDAIGVESLDDKVLRNIAPHPVDSLSEKYNERLYNFFIRSINQRVENIKKIDS